MTIQTIKDHVINSITTIYPIPKKVYLTINTEDYNSIEDELNKVLNSIPSEFVGYHSEQIATKSMLIRIDSGHYAIISKSEEVTKGEIRTDKITNLFFNV
jgi:hypothetical protein